jgi:hypothetical protein
MTFDQFKINYKFSKASISICHILEELGETQIPKKIEVLLMGYYRQLKQIDNLTAYKQLYLILVFKNINETLSNTLKEEKYQVLKTHIQSIISAIFRTKLHQLNMGFEYYMRMYKTEWRTLVANGESTKTIAERYNTSHTIVKKVISKPK